MAEPSWRHFETGTVVFVTTAGATQIGRCKGCPAVLAASDRVFHVTPSATPLGNPNALASNRDFHTRQCLVVYLAAQNQPAYDPLISWAKAILPVKP
jgi:ABC-type taurine transport system substrate-binding protein